MKRGPATLFWFVTLITAGCADKAKPEHATCIQLNAKGDFEGAWKACNASIAADPTSESGRASAELLEKLKPAYLKARAEREAAEAKAAEERAKAHAEAQAARIKDLKTRVRKKYLSDEPDALCTGKGFPPYRWSYEGGTFAENAEVASADRCQKPFLAQDSTDYCCPQKPFTGLF